MDDNLTHDEKLLVLERCEKDPIFYLIEVVGLEGLEAYQEKILEAVRDHERVVVRSCHDMGKTFTAGGVVLWFTPTHPQSKTVSTAPTGRQVKLLLWSEIRAGHAKSKYPLGGEISTTEWKIDPDWWAVGFTTQKEAAKGEGQANSGFQGIHSKGWVLVIFDEATGIAPDIWKQLEGLMTSAYVRFLALGNPTTKACEFFKCFSDPSYFKIHLSCFDSPNLPANGIHNKEDLERELAYLRSLGDEERLARLESYEVVKPYLLTAKWVMGRALKWGTSHPLFVSKAYGEFPEEDERVLMPLGTVEAAQRRKADDSDKRTYVGVDVARFGGDTSVITRLRGVVQKELKRIMKRRTTEVSGAVIHMMNVLPECERHYAVITVDATGIGSGVVDELVEYRSRHELSWHGVEIREIHFGETYKTGRDGTEDVVAEKNRTFANKKAEMFVLLAGAVRDELQLLEEDVYLEQLPTIIYKFDSKGRWVMEDKETYKKRTGLPSPDESDSLALANYGRYHTGGVGDFSEEMAKPNRQEEDLKEEW